MDLPAKLTLQTRVEFHPQLSKGISSGFSLFNLYITGMV